MLQNCYSLLSIKFNNYDVVIGPSVPLVNSFIGLILSKLNKSKFIYEIRDVWPDALVFNGIISKFNPLYLVLKIFEIFIYKFSDGLISALPNTNNYVKKYNKHLVQLYLPNSYKLYPIFKKKFNKKKLKVVYVGRFNEDHDIKIILHSAKEILFEKKIKDISFDLYGYGNLINEIKNYKILNNLSNLHLKGKIEKHKIYNLLKKYDLGLCTITNSKAYKWGVNLNKLYEYLNSSLPVVFSGNISKNPIELAKCGFAFSTFKHKDLTENILKFKKFKNKQKEELSINAKKFFNDNYNLDLNIKNLENFIRSI